MALPIIRGHIRRRLLLNYRADPDVVAGMLPNNFRPKQVRGHAVVGLCLIRLEALRPRGLPTWVGVASENAAHRFAVEWDEGDEVRTGVYIAQRHTNSRLNALAGGRIFPGVHRHTQFEVTDTGARITMRVTTKSAIAPVVEVAAQTTSTLPKASIFKDIAEASDFFEAASLGYSSRPDSQILDGLTLRTAHWLVSPLAVSGLTSEFFDDPQRFPRGSLHFDHALLMRDTPHEWHAESALEAPLCATVP